MKIKDTSSRLKEYMTLTGLKSVDIVKKCQPYCIKYNQKLEKNHFSQYLSGKSSPNQNKLYILSRALNVNPAWLMGFDVPMLPKESNENDIQTEIISREEFFKEVNNLLIKTNNLKESERQIIMNILEFLKNND